MPTGLHLHIQVLPYFASLCSEQDEGIKGLQRVLSNLVGLLGVGEEHGI